MNIDTTLREKQIQTARQNLVNKAHMMTLDQFSKEMRLLGDITDKELRDYQQSALTTAFGNATIELNNDTVQENIARYPRIIRGFGLMKNPNGRYVTRIGY